MKEAAKNIGIAALLLEGVKKASAFFGLIPSEAKELFINRFKEGPEEYPREVMAVMLTLDDKIFLILVNRCTQKDYVRLGAMFGDIKNGINPPQEEVVILDPKKNTKKVITKRGDSQSAEKRFRGLLGRLADLSEEDFRKTLNGVIVKKTLEERASELNSHLSTLGIELKSAAEEGIDKIKKRSQKRSKETRHWWR